MEVEAAQWALAIGELDDGYLGWEWDSGHCSVNL